MAARKIRTDAFHEDEEDKSRSQKKRESSALQKKGEELAALSPAIQEKLPLSPELREALAVWRGLKTWEAKRRHMQYIGRLMREQDESEALLDALEGLKNAAQRDARAFQRIESVRDSLLLEDERERARALEAALAAHPSLDRARLAHLVQATLAEREKQRPPRQGRALFRYLRDALLSGE